MSLQLVSVIFWYKVSSLITAFLVALILAAYFLLLFKLFMPSILSLFFVTNPCVKHSLALLKMAFYGIPIAGNVKFICNGGPPAAGAGYCVAFNVYAALVILLVYAPCILTALSVCV